jgi:processive 1,2-diacylglycerol beta-glucosyltransferase
MKNILILTASYGEGHNAAARGLRAGFDEVGGAKAEVVDIFPEAYGEFYERTRQDYLRLIDKAPRVWAAMFAVLDRTPLVHFVVRGLGKLERRLARLLEDRRPDAVVSTYPIYNYLLNHIAARRGQACRQYTVVTDSITVNSVWFRTKTDRFFVPNEDTARAMERAGVSRAKLLVTGFPVPPRFALNRPTRIPAGDGETGRVLYMINAGKNRAPALVSRLLQVTGIKLTVTTGRDEELRARVQEVADRAGKQIELLGWTPDMPDLLMTHHILIGKAGGAAVQETIAACTPMVITQVVPGQEEGNARLLLENHCGWLAETPDAIAAAIVRAFANNAAEWREWEQNICRISQPDAAMRIAEAILADLVASARSR